MWICKLLKSSFFSLFFIVCLLAGGLCAAELNLPLPAGAVKVGEKDSNFGPLKLSTMIYKTPLRQDKVAAFYEKEMVSAGWKLRRKGSFSKGKQLVMIRLYSGKNNETKFSITISNMPSSDEFLNMVKTKPDELNFMPLYPGSVQVISLNLPKGSAYVYEADNSVKDAVFFYESGMVRYGWTLVARSPDRNITANKVVLLFRRQNETCKIEISSTISCLNSLLAKEKLVTSKVSLKPSNKTRISVEHNVYK